MKIRIAGNRQPKRIAFIVTSQPEYGGGHQYAVTTAEILKRNAGKDYELLVVSGSRYWRKWCRQNQVRHFFYQWPGYTKQEMRMNSRVPVLAGLYNTCMTPLGQWLRKEKIDLLFCVEQGIFLPNYFVKSIKTVHDLMHRYEPDFPEVSASYEERECLFESVVSYGDVILVDSKLGKRQFTDSYLRRGRKHIQIRVLPYSIPQGLLAQEEAYIETPQKYIFYPAQFWRHKNHINLLKAVEILKQSLPDIHLVLAGSEKNCLAEIKEFIQKKGLQDQVAILGFVSDGNVKYLYRHAVALVMPTYFGPTNIPPLEAMTLGCPVAVSNKYAMPEQVGKAGLKFDPDDPDEIADCIYRLWTSEELREELIREGYRRSKAFGADQFETRLINIVLKTLGER